MVLLFFIMLMKRTLVILSFINIFIFGQVNAQNIPTIPPSGESRFLSFVREDFKLTQEGIDANLKGELIVEFRVAETGKIDSFHVVQDLGYESALQLIKTVKKAGDWDPLIVDGKRTSSWVRFPFDITYYNEFASAQPIEGYDRFIRRFNENFLIPEAAANANAYGDYLIKFDIGIDGKLSAIKLVDDPGFGILENAKRALLNSGKWASAKKMGQKFVSTIEVPFTIELKRAKRF